MTPTHRSHDMTDKLRDPLLVVMNLPTHRETLFGMAEGPALYEGQRLYLKRSEVLAELAAALAAAPQPASSCPPPQHGGDTYYTKDKTAEWWVGLTDEQFAWELTCAAQDLNDTGLGDDLDKWMPHQVMLADAAKRIKRLSAAPQPAVADREACRAKQAEPDRGFDETPYDRGYVWGYRHGLRDGKAEAAPQPAPWYEDQHRFAVVSSDYSRPFLLGAYPTLPNAVKAQCGSPEKWHIFERHSTAPQPDPKMEPRRCAECDCEGGEYECNWIKPGPDRDNALQQLADLGQQADCASETMAWAVVGKDGKMVGINYDRMTAQHLCNPGERIVRVAIRVVEGGDDAA